MEALSLAKRVACLTFDWDLRQKHMPCVGARFSGDMTHSWWLHAKFFFVIA